MTKDSTEDLFYWMHELNLKSRRNKKKEPRTPAHRKIPSSTINNHHSQKYLQSWQTQKHVIDVRVDSQQYLREVKISFQDRKFGFLVGKRQKLR
jgi:hypothetical protein